VRHRGARLSRNCPRRCLFTRPGNSGRRERKPAGMYPPRSERSWVICETNKHPIGCSISSTLSMPQFRFRPGVPIFNTSFLEAPSIGE
jgi:hypothetical protein